MSDFYSSEPYFADCVISEGSEMTLRQFLHQRFPNISKSSLQKKIDQGDVQINNRSVKLSHTPLINGDRIEIKKAFQSKEKKLDWSKRLIWISENFCVVDKPAGIASEKVAKMLGQASWMLVHRLDKETSGVLLLAKSPSMARVGHKIFQKRRVAKHYLALVCNKAPRKMTVRARLRPRLKLKGKILWEVSPLSKVLNQKDDHRAITHFHCLSQRANASLLYCRPITGKTHQIRLHAAHMGNAILGDSDYGTTNSGLCARLMLHARRLVIPELNLDAFSNPPDDLIYALKQFDLFIDPHQLKCLEDRYGALSDQ